jgi:hypothetical protein
MFERYLWVCLGDKRGPTAISELLLTGLCLGHDVKGKLPFWEIFGKGIDLISGKLNYYAKRKGVYLAQRNGIYFSS